MSKCTVFKIGSALCFNVNKIQKNLKIKNEEMSISVAFCHLSILDLSDKISAEKSKRTKSRYWRKIRL